MKAIVRDRFGPPEVLELRDINKPEVGDGDLLVRVHAASVNPLDWYAMTGTPYLARAGMGLRKPKSSQLGVDFAGVVVGVGRDVTRFKPGDEVFGARDGAFAEYLCVPQDHAVAQMPTGLPFEQAAAVPVAALTAVQGLRDHGRLQPGQQVLINGASGGVGTFAVQVAKALGAQVTGVCSTKNVDLVRSLGADQVIDYTQADFTRSGAHYDLLLDVAGSRPWSACRRVLHRHAAMVIVGGPKESQLLGPLGHIFKVRLASVPASQRVRFFVASPNRDDLVAMRELLEAGTVRPVVDRSYPLREAADALGYLGAGHARGKVVITM